MIHIECPVLQLKSTANKKNNGAGKSLDILVVYNSIHYPLRAAVADHLWSFRRYAPHRCHYINLALYAIPHWFYRLSFDLIVFHTLFLASRWTPSFFHLLAKRAAPLRNLNVPKIMLPQDEFLYPSLLCDFIREFGITHVFSVAPETEWPKIYKTVDLNKIKFKRVLTGYLDERRIGRIQKSFGNTDVRPIDIGYRTRSWQAAPWLGRQAFLKAHLAEIFKNESIKRNINHDISTQQSDILMEDQWYEFLYRCKYTFGIEGGASILDWDGTIKEKTERYMALHPNACFDEVENACFKNLEQSLHLVALSPRHLEACLTKTCQILIEGEYNGILTPGKHYLELRKDLGNLDEILALVKEDRRRISIAETAYQEIVNSGRYTYRKFVEEILDSTLGDKIGDKKLTTPQPQRFLMSLVSVGLLFMDWLAWRFLVFIALMQNRIIEPFFPGVPARMKRWLKRLASTYGTSKN